MRRYLIPVVFGIGGIALLVFLGLWQLQRLEWKEGIIAERKARIHQTPVAMPLLPTPDADQYLPIEATGRALDEALYVVTSAPGLGPGFRLISAFEIGGRRILLGEGFVLHSGKGTALSATDLKVVGNLFWPDEVDRFTPAPEAETAIWYARDVKAMAEVLDTEPVLLVARSMTGGKARATPLPVSTSGIVNNHLGYAIQWFGLAAVWAGMTLFLLWHIRQRTV